MLLEATVRADEGIFHLTVPISEGGDDDEDGEDEELEGDEDEEPTLQVTVALSASEDGSTLFATRRLCAYDDEVDLESLLREVSGTIHVQLSIDEDDDVVLSVEYRLAELDPSEVRDAVDVVSFYADKYYDEVGRLARS